MYQDQSWPSVHELFEPQQQEVPYVHSIIKYLSVFRQVNSLFQTEFSKECDLELPPSTSSIFLFP
jgi:hypothetical protein